MVHLGTIVPVKFPSAPDEARPQPEIRSQSTTNGSPIKPPGHPNEATIVRDMPIVGAIGPRSRQFGPGIGANEAKDTQGAPTLRVLPTRLSLREGCGPAVVLGA
jgi:hypothetical protein